MNRIADNHWAEWTTWSGANSGTSARSRVRAGSVWNLKRCLVHQESTTSVRRRMRWQQQQQQQQEQEQQQPTTPITQRQQAYEWTAVRNCDYNL